MRWKKPTDREIIHDIEQGGQRADNAFQYLYEKSGIRQMAAQHIRRHGGSEEDAKDTIHDAMIELFRNIRLGKFRGESALSSYFVGIVKNLWLKKLRKLKGTTFTDQIPETADDYLEGFFISEERKNALQSVIDQLAPRCRKMLHLYGLGYSPAEIAEAFGLSGAQAAKKETHRCRARLKVFIENSPGLNNLLN